MGMELPASLPAVTTPIHEGCKSAFRGNRSSLGMAIITAAALICLGMIVSALIKASAKQRMGEAMLRSFGVIGNDVPPLFAISHNFRVLAERMNRHLDAKDRYYNASLQHAHNDSD